VCEQPHCARAACKAVARSRWPCASPPLARQHNGGNNNNDHDDNKTTHKGAHTQTLWHTHSHESRKLNRTKLIIMIQCRGCSRCCCCRRRCRWMTKTKRDDGGRGEHTDTRDGRGCAQAALTQTATRDQCEMRTSRAKQLAAALVVVRELGRRKRWRRPKTTAGRSRSSESATSLRSRRPGAVS
jgi:hypothetical protein